MDGVGLLPEFDAGASVLAYQLVERDVRRLFVPVEPDGTVLAWRSDRSELVVSGFTELVHLWRACGREQPWQELAANDLIRMANTAPSPVVFAVDMRRPHGAVHVPDQAGGDDAPLSFEPRVEVPAEVWIPSLPVAPGARIVRPELYGVSADELMLLAYRSAADLHDACGPHQPAFAVPVERLEDVVRETGAHGVVFDAVLADAVRHQAPVLDWAVNDHFGEPARGCSRA